MTNQRCKGGKLTSQFLVLKIVTTVSTNIYSRDYQEHDLEDEQWTKCGRSIPFHDDHEGLPLFRKTRTSRELNVDHVCASFKIEFEPAGPSDLGCFFSIDTWPCEFSEGPSRPGYMNGCLTGHQE